MVKRPLKGGCNLVSGQVWPWFPNRVA